MLKKKVVQALVLLAALSLSTRGALAAGALANAKIDVFVLGGGSTFIDEHYFNDSGRVFVSHFQVGPKVTIGISVPYGSILSIESSYTWGPNDWVVQNNNLSPRVSVVYPMRLSSGNLSGVIHVPFSRFHFRPYVDGGVEYDQFIPTTAAINYATLHGFATASTASINTSDKVGLSVGFGVERKIFKRLSLRIDVRDHVTSSPNFGIPPASTAANPAPFDVAGRGNNIEYTAGIVFHLGKL